VATSDNRNLLSALEVNWQAEMEGFQPYTALSKAEANPHRRNHTAFSDLSDHSVRLKVG